jgi:hypothetical protein
MLGSLLLVYELPICNLKKFSLSRTIDLSKIHIIHPLNPVGLLRF